MKIRAHGYWNISKNEAQKKYEKYEENKIHREYSEKFYDTRIIEDIMTKKFITLVRISRHRLGSHTNYK